MKSVHPVHKCNRQDFLTIQVSPRFLAKEYLHMFQKIPAWPRTSLQAEVLKRFGKSINRQVCYAVKKYAHKALYGSMADHYNKIDSYMAELERADPHTRVVLVTEPGDIPRAPALFQRLYVSFEALR